MSVPNRIDPEFFAGLERATSFYIIRHGETTSNEQRRVQGLIDAPLNERGRAQAAAVAQWFREKPIRRVLCSPLSRASESAAILAREAGLPEPVVEPALMEVDTGRFSGLTLDEARQRYPVDYERFAWMSWDGVEDAERAESIALRARASWAALKTAAAESGGDVLAVSHGGTMQFIVRVTFGCSTWMPLLSTGNCGIFELSVQPTGAGRPAYLHWKHINLVPGDPEGRVPPVF